MSNRPLTVSFGTSASLAVIASAKQLPWGDFARWLTTTPPEHADKAARGWFCPVEFQPAYRDSENFVARHALTYDFDHVELDTWQRVKETWDALAFAMYTTWSHVEAKPRFRVVLPLSRPATYDEFQAVARRVATDIGIELFARESFTPAQMMFSPTRKPEGMHRSHINNGAWLEVDEVLAEYKDWTDVSQWPTRREADGVHKSDARTSPLDKDGLVGDWCRAFSIEDVIKKFGLPYTRVR